MPLVLVEEQVNIYQMPEAITLPPYSQVTVGDLHGNTMKLLFMLVKHGVIKEMTDDIYELLVETYTFAHKEGLKDYIISWYVKALIELEYNPSIGIRLIGDELCDRGSNDYLTLILLNQLHRNKVPVEIILSNHGIDFLEAWEKGEAYRPAYFDENFGRSMYNLQQLIIVPLLV
jgi:hypothetical protein